jgi:hypothetical protein
MTSRRRQRRRLGRLALAGAAMLAGCRSLPADELRQAVAVDVTASAVPLNGQYQSLEQTGLLRYRGGLVLSAREPHFGGLSGLSVSADGTRFAAISDMGYWVRGRLEYDNAGDLGGVSAVTMGPLLDPKGRVLVGKAQGDAEAMAPDGRGGMLVGFEQNHRLWRYAALDRPAAATDAPAGLKRSPANGGLEALARLADGRYLALSEAQAVPGGTRGWVGGPGHWSALTFVTVDGFAPTDAAGLPDGEVLVLERRFPPVGARIRRIRAGAIAPGARLEGEELARLEGSDTVDNMEGIAVRSGPAGETLIYLLSDDNYSALQRTLLMMFEIAP